MSNPRGTAGYPRGVSIDFRKLDDAALQKYVEHYQLALRAGLSHDELAVLVRAFFSFGHTTLLIPLGRALGFGHFRPVCVCIVVCRPLIYR
jgi:hypothetical protein